MSLVKARVNGIDCILYYDERIQPDKAPPGYPYVYHIRHAENNWIQPVNLERFVLVNFFGTVFMKEPVEIEESGYVEIIRFWMEKGWFSKFSIRDSILRRTFGLADDPPEGNQ